MLFLGGLDLDIKLVQKRDSNILQSSTEVFKSLYFIEAPVWLYWSFLLSFCYCWTASFWEKTSCMIQQCFQSCCIYPLWICCDCTVLYLSITGNYMVLYVCQGLHTLTNTHRIPYNEIDPNALSLALCWVSVYCVQCFHYPVTVHQWTAGRF